jgi:hypothetical protein
MHIIHVHSVTPMIRATQHPLGLPARTNVRTAWAGAPTEPPPRRQEIARQATFGPQPACLPAVGHCSPKPPPDLAVTIESPLSCATR